VSELSVAFLYGVLVTWVLTGGYLLSLAIEYDGGLGEVWDEVRTYTLSQAVLLVVLSGVGWLVLWPVLIRRVYDVR